MSENYQRNLDDLNRGVKPAAASGDPSILDTQPIQPRKSSASRIPRWFVISILPLVLVGVFVVLALPSLLAPPPGAAIPYEVFTFGESSVKLDPSTDHLIISEDQKVGLYIPIGIELGAGEMVMLPRKLDFVPSVNNEVTERLSAIDLFVVRPDGEVMTTTAVNGSILLCFALTSEQVEQEEQNLATYFIERYDDAQDPPNWIALPPAVGWQEGQACAALDHLSLFALSKRRLTEPTTIPGSKQLDATQTPTPDLELYGVPIGSQEE